MWNAALIHAGLGHDQAFLLPLQGAESGDRCGGKSWPPVLGLHQDEVPESAWPWLDDLNRDDVRMGYRLALWTDRSIEGQAALARHELEHGHQLAAGGVDMADLHGLAEAIVSTAPHSGALYQRIPMEADANAASADFVRQLYGDDHVNKLIEGGHPDSAAFRRADPGSIVTLHDRMIDFFVDHGDLCMRWAELTNRNFAGILEIPSREGRREWCERTGLDGKPPGWPGPGPS